jgi:hypothetical protein
MPYVYSTATCTTSYVLYKEDKDKNSGFAEAVKKVTINGGHGVATKHLVTPKGIVTKVSEDDLAFLLADINFQRHMKAGFMMYEKSKKVDTEKKVENMAKGDNSAPLVPKDFTESKHSDENNRIYKGLPKK